MTNELPNLVEPIREALVEDRRHLHRHPELSFEEHNTAAWVVDRLRSHGLAPESVGVTGVTARIMTQRPGPVVAFRADMDALPLQDAKTCAYRSTAPGMAHACGHDGHVAMLLGLAQIVSEHPELVRGELRLLFQPAEEKPPGGARSMIDAGALDGVDAIFGVHLWSGLPTGQIGVHTGPTMAASDSFQVTVSGRGGHAGMPHESIDALIVAARSVVDLQLLVSRYVDPLQPAVVNIGKLTAGTQFNIIADHAEFAGTVRTFDETTRAVVRERLEELLRASCEGAGARFELSYRPGYPALVNHAVQTDLVRAAIRSLPTVDLVEIRPSMAGEDFAYYLERLPGCFFFVGAGNAAKGADYPNHHPLFDIDEDALPLGVQALLATYLRYGAASGRA